MTILTIASFLEEAPPVPAVLSDGTLGTVTSTTAQATVDTTVASGIIYTAYAQQASPLAIATIKETGSVLGVTSSGTKTVNALGMTPGTTGLYLHIVHSNGGLDSNVVVIGPFNTASLGAGTGTVSLTIPRRGDILSGGEGVGPFPMFFRTLVSDNGVTEPASARSYDPTQAGFAYVVDLGLGGPTRYEYLTHVPDIHNNMNVAYAKDFSACYQPGTYTVVVNVFRHDGTFVGAGTQTFTIRDPLIEITSVFLVNNAGATDAAYPGAAAYTTLGQAIAAANTAGVTSLILMRRGQTHPQNTQIAIPSSCPHFIVSTYGTGTKPLVTTTFGGELIRPNDAWNRNNVYRNIRFQGGYNTITESGTAPTLYRTGVGGSITTKGVLFDGCEFDGFNQAANLITGVVETNHFYMLHNCKSDIGRGFYVFQGPNSGTYVSFRGTSMLADPRHALGGGDGGNLYGCMRIVCAKRLFLESSEFFSRATPSANSNFNLQPTLRLLTAPEDSQQRMFGYMTGCYVDGGNQAVTLPMSNGSQAGDVLHGINFIGLKNYLVGATANTKLVNMRMAGQHWVNNIMVLCDAKSNGTYNPGGWEAFFTFDSDKATPPGGEDTTSPVRAWHNTCINLRTVANMNGRDAPFSEGMSIKWSSQWAEAGNIIYQPNLPGEPNTAGVTFTQDSILSDNGQAWVPLWTNVAHRATASLPAVTFDTSYGAASGQAWDGRITAGPTTARLWLDDFYNELRSATTQAGAVGRLAA
jgi:hypothetical protein